MADFSKIGRNNKNRGRSFERKVAEKLGWTRVPYSGAIKEWGGADVVDGFYTRNGWWAAECKTQQPGNTWSLSIKDKWVKQMLGGEQNGRHGIIITKNVGQKKIGSGDEPYVFMLEDTLEWFEGRVGCTIIFALDETKTLGKGHNFVVKAEQLAFVGDGVGLGLKVVQGDDHTMWYILSLDDFATYVLDNEIFVPEIKPDAQ